MSATWPAMRVTMRPVAELRPYAKNARKHERAHVAQIAESIRRFGWTIPVLVAEDGTVIAGHGRLLAAKQLGVDRVPVMVAEGWTDEQRRAYAVADNQLTIAGDWDREVLARELQELAALKVPLDSLGFSSRELDKLLDMQRDRERLAAAAEIGDRFDAPRRAESGQLWVLGDHRVLCGDATFGEDVARLMGDDCAQLVHADPPYGLGKEAEGVANDNLRGEKLDAFQLQWLDMALAAATENASLYVWGQAPDLWRLWWCFLQPRGGLVLRNELVWAKGNAIGVGSSEMHSFPGETERCLFLMRGQQFLGNQNKDDYWAGYEPLRAWLCEQRDAMRWGAAQVNKITGTQMAGHWFGKSQFQPVSREHYEKLQAAAGGFAFELDYDAVLALVAPGASDHRAELSEAMREGRSYFDAALDNATDVWRFDRVVGAERFGHATPKPVAMIARAVRASCPEGGLVYEPFLGTGSTLVACEISGRRCFGLDVEPRCIDVVLHRWEQVTGKKAELL